LSRVIEVKTKAEIAKYVEENPKVIVDFAAESSCIPCQRLKPHYEAVSDAVTDTVWLHADIDLNPDLQNEFVIMSVPTLMAYKDGEYVGQLPNGINTGPKLANYAKTL
jgi:thioredoxin 1